MRLEMKKGLTLIAVGITMLTTVTGDAQAQCVDCNLSKKCSESYGRVSHLTVPKKTTTCSLGRRVLDKWMQRDGLEGTVRVRIGRDGVLWKCHGSRAFGKLNPWYINCWSSQVRYRWDNDCECTVMTQKSTAFQYRRAN